MTAADCRTCGACCGPLYDYETHVDLLPADMLRLSSQWRRKHVVESGVAGSIRTVRNHNGTVCAALRGAIGTNVSCSIYERRPDGCRAFKPGSRGCLDARQHLEIV